MLEPPDVVAHPPYSFVVSVEAQQAKDDKLPVGRLIFRIVRLRLGFPLSSRFLFAEDLGDFFGVIYCTLRFKDLWVVRGIVEDVCKGKKADGWVLCLQQPIGGIFLKDELLVLSHLT